MDQQLTVDEAFEIAFSRHLEGKLEEAEAIYRMIQEALPEEPRSLHFLGVLLHQKGDEAGIGYVRRSVELVPNWAEWRNDLGNILTARGDLQGAREEFSQAARLNPNDPLVWNNLGAVTEKLGQREEARSAFAKAIELYPDFGDALVNMANSLAADGREVEAAEFHCRAYVLDPAGKPKSMLGIAYYNLGRYTDAAEIYRQWMEEEPENPTPRHLYAACSGKAVPERAAEEYVEKTFDEFAPNFEKKLASLDYRGPELIAQALSRHSVSGAVLDAGCGTGLCAQVLAPLALRLVGVDLSRAMLEEAKKTGLYHELVKEDLGRYLKAHPSAFDLIVAADTLTYFGALEELSADFSSALHPGGLLVFTTEEADENENVRLNPHGRYSHSKSYLAATLKNAGFEVLEMESGTLRVEFGQPVKCVTVTARHAG